MSTNLTVATVLALAGVGAALFALISIFLLVATGDDPCAEIEDLDGGDR
jgi:predicted exporter